MDKFIMLFKFFFGCFRTFNLSRSIYRIYNHFLFFNRSRKIAICVCDSSSHNNNSIVNLYLNTAIVVPYVYLYTNLSKMVVKWISRDKLNYLTFHNDTDKDI